MASNVDLAHPDGVNVLRIDRAHANAPIALGDSNRDGFDDVGYSAPGTAFFYYGRASTPPIIGLNQQSTQISGVDIGYELIADGRHCSAIDGFGAVSRPGFAAAKVGVRTPSGPPNTYQLRIDCGDPTTSARGLGDLNGDGSTELWMGTVTQRAGYIMAGATPGTPGSIFCPNGSTSFCSGGYIYRSSITNLDDDAWPIGDVNNDGRTDIAFNSYDVAYVVHGLSGQLPTADLDSIEQPAGFKVVRPPDVDGRVLRVTGGSDFDGDGYNDLAIAYEATRPGIPNAGAVLVLFGAMSGFPSVVDIATSNPATFALFFGSVPALEFGIGIAATRDYDADGIGDLVIMQRSTNQLILLGSSTRWTSAESAALPMATVAVNSPGISGGTVVQSDFDFNDDGHDDILWHFGSQPVWITFGLRPDQLFSDGFEVVKIPGR